MILTHGGNSVSGRGNDNYILDNFVALYNGVTDSGYAINDGSFGQLLWDANGPIHAPNGQGTPYYARANFSGDNGGVQAIYPELANLTSVGNWTIDFWYYRDSTIELDNGYIAAMSNSSQSPYSMVITVPTGKAASNEFNIITINGTNNNASPPISSNGWMHIAIVSRAGTSNLCYINGELAFSSPVNIRATDTSKLRFRFYGSAGGVRIAQFALRDYAVWTSNFTPPTLLYKQI